MLTKSLLRPLLVAVSSVLILLTVAITLIPVSLLGVGDAVAEKDALDSVWNDALSSATDSVRKAYMVAYRSAQARAEAAVEAEILCRGDDPLVTTTDVISIILLDGAEAPSDATVPSLTVCECLAVYGVVSGYADSEGTYGDPASLHWDSLDQQDGEGYPSFIERIRSYAAGLYSPGPVSCSLVRVVSQDGEVTFRGTVTAEILRHEPGFMREEREKAAESLTISGALTAEQAKERIDREISASFDALRSTFSAGSAKIGRSELFERIMHLPVYAAFCVSCPSFGPPFPWEDVTSRYGPRILRGKYSFHTGIDFGEKRGTPVFPVAAGLVVFAYGGCLTDNDPSAGYGNYVIVYHGRRDGKDIYTLYAHLHAVNVREGETVTAATCLGQVGSRGNSTGPHLHFEINTYDPVTGEACAVDPEGFAN